MSRISRFKSATARFNGAKTESGAQPAATDRLTSTRLSRTNIKWPFAEFRKIQAATVSPAMELWSSGFNAWGQLDFQGKSSTEYRDLRTFESVLRDQRVEILRTTLSATLGKPEAFPSSLGVLFSPKACGPWVNHSCSPISTVWSRDQPPFHLQLLVLTSFDPRGFEITLLGIDTLSSED